VEDERRSSNGAVRLKQDVRQMGMIDGSRMKGRKAVIEEAQIQYDEMCSTERAEGFMAPFRYLGDAFVSIASGSNDAPLPDTKLHALTSGIANDWSFTVPLVIGWLLVSGRGAPLLHDAVKIEASR
jgi:hypothetical protein